MDVCRLDAVNFFSLRARDRHFGGFDTEPGDLNIWQDRFDHHVALLYLQGDTRPLFWPGGPAALGIARGQRERTAHVNAVPSLARH